MPQQRHALFHLVARANRELATKYSHRVKGVDFFSHVLLDFQESVTSPAAQQGADGDKAGDQKKIGHRYDRNCAELGERQCCTIQGDWGCF